MGTSREEPADRATEQDAELAAALLESFRRGERAAFLEVYRAHAGEVRRLAGRWFSAPFEREEAIQEIWLMLHRMSGSFDPSRGPLLPWLRTVGHNRCRELLRAKGRRPQPDAELEEALVLDAPDPERAARLARARAALESFSARLPPDEAKVLTLGLFEGRTNEETAEALKITVRQCKYLKKKLLQRAAGDSALREALAELGEADEP